MHWTTQQINQHREAAQRLVKIKTIVFQLLRKQPTISEYDAVQFVLEQYKKHNLKTDHHPPIVAFRQNTAHVHYFPSQHCLRLQPNSLILLDIWARFNRPGAPFADITWMGYKGQRIPIALTKMFALVVRARNQALVLLRDQSRYGTLPSGQRVDQAARQVIVQAHYAKNFPHSTGHALGTTSPHGSPGRISTKNPSPLHRRLGYTIEPGVYLPNKFGIRSEINFYIDTKGKIVISTAVQKSLTKI